MFCPNCGIEIENGSQVCKNCGGTIRPDFNVGRPEENTSGQGSTSVVPDGIKGWSWGGFLWTWIWALGNKTWIGLLAIIPSVGLIMRIILGIYGNQWAWKNKRWDSVEHFKKVQRKWTIWGLILNILVSLGFAMLFTLINPRVSAPTGGLDLPATNPVINPGEQLNKAIDAKLMNNSSELWNAFDRYYYSNNRYPWQADANSNPTILTGINNASWMELLYSSSELKSTFKTNLSNADEKYTLYSNGTDVFVCFNPKSSGFILKAKTRCSTDTIISSTDLCLSGREQVCVPETAVVQPTSATSGDTIEGRFCGGIAANLPENQCPVGYTCQLDGNFPDAAGKCVKN